MLQPINITLSEKKLFCNNNIFTGFTNITEERKKQIETLIQKYKQLNYFGQINNYLVSPNKYLYQKTLDYLINNHCQLITLDEKLFFLINIIDPNCHMYELYLSYPNELSNSSKENLIREKMGFFSSYLLKCEFYYTVQFHNKLIINVNKDYFKKFIILLPLVKSFDNVTEQRLEHIENQAILYKEIPNINLNYQTCIYNILYQAQVLELNNIQEQLLFFIKVMDPELTLLKIYSEESNYKNIEKRSLEELGFFHKILIKDELLYYQKFCPNKKISEWAL